MKFEIIEIEIERNVVSDCHVDRGYGRNRMNATLSVAPGALKCSNDVSICGVNFENFWCSRRVRNAVDALAVTTEMRLCLDHHVITVTVLIST